MNKKTDETQVPTIPTFAEITRKASSAVQVLIDNGMRHDLAYASAFGFLSAHATDEQASALLAWANAQANVVTLTCEACDMSEDYQADKVADSLYLPQCSNPNCRAPQMGAFI
ncbi:MAG: hypothetical protein EBX40_07620 [Gammaproteobacteria bacterium]|nr:hypothetical protein [Gammaproteobacteria bacterium]